MEGKKMNVLTLLFFDKDIIRYGYQPEGKGKNGVISYNIKNGTVNIETKAEDDANSYYANMAKSKVEAIIKAKNLPLECVQAWY